LIKLKHHKINDHNTLQKYPFLTFDARGPTHKNIELKGFSIAKINKSLTLLQYYSKIRLLCANVR